MSDPARPLNPPPVRIVFRPYDHDAVQNLLRGVRRDFGRPGDRYRFSSPADSHEANAWSLDFHFRDPADALIFALKFSGI